MGRSVETQLADSQEAVKDPENAEPNISDPGHAGGRDIRKASKPSFEALESARRLHCFGSWKHALVVALT